MNFVSAAPSTVPSVEPSLSPVSSSPSALPTITGSVVFVELSKQVTASLTEEEVSAIVQNAEETFGLFPDNVEAVVTYSVSGTVDVSLEGDYDEQELVEALQESLAISLGVHESDVTVSVDPDTGVISYVVTSPTAEAAAALQDVLQTSEVNDAVLSGLSSALPNVSEVLVFNFHCEYVLGYSRSYFRSGGNCSIGH